MDRLPSVLDKGPQLPSKCQHQDPHCQPVLETSRKDNHSPFYRKNCVCIDEEGCVTSSVSHGDERQRHSCSFLGYSDSRWVTAKRKGVSTIVPAMTSQKVLPRKQLDFNSTLLNGASNSCSKQTHLQPQTHRFDSHHFKATPQRFVLLRHLFSVFLILSLFSVASAESSLHHTTEQRHSQTSPYTWTITDLGTENSGHHSNQIDSSGIPDLAARVDRLFRYQIPENAFGNPVENYKASQAGTNGLPSWLHFDQSTATFVGVPLSLDIGKVYITLEAATLSSSDDKKKSSTVSELFAIHIQPVFAGDENSNLQFAKPSDPFTAKKTQPEVTIPDSHSPNLQSSDPQSPDFNPKHNIECIIPANCAETKTEEISANLLILVNISSLTAHQRADLFITVSRLLSICPESLSLRHIDWSSREGVLLWSQLVDSDSLEYVSSATILSYQIACSVFDFDFDNEGQSVIFEKLESSVVSCKDGIAISDGHGSSLVLVYDQWFVSAGNDLIIQLKVNSNRRVRRQIEVIDDGPVGTSGFNPPDDELSSSVISITPSLATAATQSSETSFQTRLTTSETGITSVDVMTPVFTPPSSLIIAPPTRVIPTLEASRILVTASPISAITSQVETTTATPDLETSEIFQPLTSIPVMSILSSIEFNSMFTTAVQVIETTTPSFSFSIASSVEIITPTSITLTSIPSSDTVASPTFVISSSVLQPFTSIPVFTMTSVPVLTVLPTSTDILMPMPTSELTLSLSIFTPSSFADLPSSFPVLPTQIETSTVASTSDIFIMPTTTTTEFLSTPILSLFSSPELTLSISTFIPALITTSVQLSSLATTFVEPTTSTVFSSETFVPFTSSVVLEPTTSTVFSSETFVPFTSSVALEPTTSTVFSSETFVPFTSSVVLEPTTSTVFSSETFVPFTSSVALEPTSTVAVSSVESTPSPTPSPTPSTLPTTSVSPFLTSTLSPSFSFLTSTLSPSFSPSPSPSPIPMCDVINCNNGTCMEIFDSFICICYEGWTGEFCDVDIDFCVPPPLGPCDLLGADTCIEMNSTFECSCMFGYTGQNCTMDIDECDPNPCRNGAKCNNMLNGIFTCDCLPDFTGLICEDDATPCEPSPCMRGEICLDLGPGNFSCQFPIQTSTPVITPSVSSIVETSSLQISSSAISSSVEPSQTSTIAFTPSSSLSESAVFSSTPQPLSTSITTSTPSPTSITTSTPSPTPITTSTPSPTPTPLPPNTSPLLLNPVGVLRVTEGQVFRFEIPEETFFDFESGTTSSLILSLLESNGSPISDLSWVQLRGLFIEGIPLNSQVVSNAVTEYTFVLRAEDERGAQTHDIVTVQIIPQLPVIANFLAVFLEGNFEVFNRNLSAKIQLLEQLSTIPSPLQPPDTDVLYVNAFRSGSISVSYSNLSIPDSNCADFRTWVAAVFTNGNYTPNFYQALSPTLPTSMPIIEGPCNISATNPTLGQTPDQINRNFQSELQILLAAIIPTVVVALLIVIATLLGFGLYRRRRSEREDELRIESARRAFLNRRPILLPGEAELPNRGRHPTVFANELAIQDEAQEERQRELLLEEIDEELDTDTSDEELVVPLLLPNYDPPAYRLPPDYIPPARI